MPTAEGVIRSVSNNQHEILYNIAKLYNDGNAQFDVDLTYSEGNFYGDFTVKSGDDGEQYTVTIPQPTIKCDIAPMTDDIVKLDPWGELPFEDNSFKTVVFDPPFVISPRDCKSVIDGNEKSCMIFNRFSGYYPVNELLDSYKSWLERIYRVLKDDGILIFKCQPTVTGGKQLNSHHYIWFIAESLGYDLIDEFLLVSNQRLISGKVTKQVHARKYHSYFYVLKKSTKKKTVYLNFLNDKEIAQVLGGFRNNNLGKKHGENHDYRKNYVRQTHILSAEERKQLGE